MKNQTQILRTVGSLRSTYRRVRTENDAPQNDGGGRIARDRQPLKEERSGDLPSEEAKLEISRRK